MIQLEAPIRLTQARCESPNLVEGFSDEDLGKIGRAVLDGYKLDEESRSKWKKRNDSALNLALQLQEQKTFPWAGAANVKFPLVTIAAIQWHSRAYPLLIQGPDIVKMRTTGPDPEGKRRVQADRVGSYMSYQLLEESDTWEEETDRALLQVPIVGCAFKKTYRSSEIGQNTSELVSAKDFVIDYWAKSIPTAQRKTHLIQLHRNDIHTRVMSGIFCDVMETHWFNGLPAPKGAEPNDKSDRRTGQARPTTVDETTPFDFLEQHVKMDLDGDGYAEPYIITVEASMGHVCRIVANFSWANIVWRNEKKYQIIRIREDQYFTKYPFIPSPDGGFYDIGFGLLLGPLNEAVDSLINQLIDAGTLATTAGGFLGRGVKIRGGEYTFRPFGWQRVDSTGEDLSKGIFPFPVREPSSTLFNLLSLLVDYTNRISGSTDIMVGENPGQNTPAQTSQLMAEQGAKINSAIFKRVWRGFKEEFQKMFRLNREHTPVSVTEYGEASGWISREDFMGPEEAIRPAADPNLSSDGHRTQQASVVKQSAASTPGYDKDAVERMWLRSLRVESLETIFPGSKAVPPTPHPKVILEQMKLQGKAASDKSRILERVIQIQADRDKTKAEIELIQAEIAVMVNSIGEAQAASQVKAFEAHIGALKAMDDSQRGYMELLQKGMQDGGGQQGGLPGMGQPPGNAGGAQPPAPGGPGQ